MARTSKPKTTESTESVAPQVVESATPAVVEKKVSKKASKSSKTEQTATPVVVASTPAPAPEVVDQEVAPVASDNEAPVAEQSIEFLAKLQQLGVFISSLKTEYRTLEKKWTRELKTAQKQSSKRKRKTGNRAPSGFVKPTRISDELAKFLEKPNGTEMARTEVTREINTYIHANNLQDEKNGRKINPDAKLAALLKLKKSDELTYFNLQRYMSPHFAKSVKAEVATSSATA
jgi:upstream activation factor subunit UAF30